MKNHFFFLRLFDFVFEAQSESKTFYSNKSMSITAKTPVSALFVIHIVFPSLQINYNLIFVCEISINNSISAHHGQSRDCVYLFQFKLNFNWKLSRRKNRNERFNSISFVCHSGKTGLEDYTSKWNARHNKRNLEWNPRSYNMEKIV